MERAEELALIERFERERGVTPLAPKYTAQIQTVIKPEISKKPKNTRSKKSFENMRRNVEITARNKTVAFDLKMWPIFVEIIASGIKNPIAIANELNRREIANIVRTNWSKESVERMFKRLEL